MAASQKTFFRHAEKFYFLSTEPKNWPVMKLPRFSFAKTMRKKARQFQKWPIFGSVESFLYYISSNGYYCIIRRSFARIINNQQIRLFITYTSYVS